MLCTDTSGSDAALTALAAEAGLIDSPADITPSKKDNDENGLCLF